MVHLALASQLEACYYAWVFLSVLVEQLPQGNLDPDEPIVTVSGGPPMSSVKVLVPGSITLKRPLAFA